MIPVLDRIFRGDLKRDGQSAELEALATGLGVGPAAPAEAAAGRRHRPLAEPRTSLDLILSQKVLHGWLQNRHQTLFPLTVNLGTLEPGHAILLAQMAAIAALAGSTGQAEALDRAAAWFSSLGAEPAVLHAFKEARRDPPSLSTTLASLQEHGMAPYAYVAARIALDPHDPAGRLFLDYLAERLGLPTTLVRSADRRYGSGPLRPSAR